MSKPMGVPNDTSRVDGESDDLVSAYQMLAKVAAMYLPVNSPERLWVEWLAANHDRLYTATVEMGVMVEEGPGFIDRLKSAVIPKLLERPENNERTP